MGKRELDVRREGLSETYRLEDGGIRRGVEWSGFGRREMHKSGRGIFIITDKVLETTIIMVKCQAWHCESVKLPFSL